MFNRIKGSYFAKLVISHLAITVLLVALGGGLLLNKTADLMTREMKSTGEAQLLAMKDRLEREQLQSFNSALLNKALSTVRSEAESEIQFFLDNGKAGQYYRISRFTQDLKTLSMSMPTLHNLSFYFAKDQFVIDHYFHNTPERSPQAELLGAVGEIPTHQWFLRSLPAEHGERPNVLSYVYTLPYMARGDQIRGYMIVDVDAQKLIASLGQHLGASGEKLVVLEDSGQIIGASSEWSESMLKLVREHLSAGEGAMIKQEEHVLSILPSSDSAFQWNYALLRPQHAVLLTTQKMKQEIWAGALIILLLGALVSYLVSKQCYGTFGYVLQRIRSVSGQIKAVQQKNEIGWLDQALGFLDEQQLRYLAGLKEKQWREVIQGTLAYDEVELLLPAEGSYMPVSLVLDGIDRVCYAQLLAQAEALDGLHGEFIPLRAGEVIIVYWCKEKPALFEQRVRRQLEEAAGRSAVPFRYTAGVGRVADKLEDIHWSVVEAQAAARYGFLSESSVCISSNEVQQREGRQPELALERFETLLRSGEWQELQQFMSECETELRNGEYAIEAIEYTLIQLELYASKALMMLGGKGAGAQSESFAYRKQPTLGAFFEALRETAEAVYEQRSEKRNERYERILSGIREYVDRHMDKDISLEQLSEMTSYSKQFICKLFKEELNMTFVDYITQQRLEHAAGLLVATDDTVGSIAERSGFRSSQYFSTKFKVKYGVTPVQYRQAHGEIQILYNDFKSCNG